MPLCLAVHIIEEKLMTTSSNQNHLIEASTRILYCRIVPSTRLCVDQKLCHVSPGRMKPCTLATCDFQPSIANLPALLETIWKYIPYQDLSEYNLDSYDLSIASHGIFIRES